MECSDRNGGGLETWSEVIHRNGGLGTWSKVIGMVAWKHKV